MTPPPLHGSNHHTPPLSSPPLGKITNCLLSDLQVSLPTQSCTLSAIGPLWSTNPLGAGQPKYQEDRGESILGKNVIRVKSCNFPEGVVKKILGMNRILPEKGVVSFFSGCIYVMEMDPLLSLSRGYMSEG